MDVNLFHMSQHMNSEVRYRLTQNPINNTENVLECYYKITAETEETGKQYRHSFGEMCSNHHKNSQPSCSAWKNTVIKTKNKMNQNSWLKSEE